jgi:hypothetical protein
MPDVADDLSHEVPLKVFWTNPINIAMLRKGVASCGRSVNKIQDYASTLGLANIYYPQAAAIRRFALSKQDGFQSDFHTTGLLIALIEILNENTAVIDSDQQTPPDRKRVSDQKSTLAGLQNTFRNLCEDVPELSCVKLRKATRATVTDSDIGSLIHLLAKQYGIKPSDFIDIGAFFFPELQNQPLPEKPLRARFAMYRFHSKPKFVVKTFTSIESPTIETPACVFSNYFDTSNAKGLRRTDGIIVPTKNVLYFVGGMLGAAGLKFMAVKRQSRGPEALRGLVMTLDEDDELIAARFVMMHTEALSHTDAEVGVYPLAKVRNEIGSHIDQIRNRIPFQLEKTVRLGNTVVRQDEIADETRKAFDRKGGKKLMADKTHFFNPASDREYTFNAALVNWHKSEPSLDSE